MSTKKERPRLKVRSIHVLFCRVIISLWQKIKQDTSLFLLYPESIPEDWETKLELLGVPMAISPIHDKDLSEMENQKYKKHIIT